MAKKDDLTKILIDKYGYEKEDLKFNAEGKPYTNAKLQILINEEEEDSKELETNKNRVVAKKDTLKDEDKIKVMSGSMGTVIYRSDISRRIWKFTSFGQVESIPYGELVTIRNRFNGYFKNGWLIILDAEVQKEFGLTEMYQNILTPDNLNGVFQKSIDEIEVIVDNLPDGMKNTFVNKAQELYASEKLDSVKVIKLIEEKFGFSLKDNAPLSDIL